MEDIQKELRVRHRVMGIYNKLQEDFPSKQDWDDYLEQIEDIIYNLVNRIDEKATEIRVQEYERANRLNIISNQARLAEQLKKSHLQVAEDTVGAEEATAGMGPATGPISFQQPQTLLAAQPQPLVPPVLDAEGRLPAPRPSASRFEAMAAASGWSQDLPRARALQEAFSSLLVF